MNKNFDVYGLGNALVDLEYEVSDDVFAKTGVTKGLMTLVDEARQTELIKTTHGVGHKKTCGGSAANTMIGLAQLGGTGFYACKVANDEFGHFYFKELLENGVQSNLTAENLETGVTGKCMVFITPDGDRTLNTFLGISTGFSVKDLNEEQIKSSNYIYIEGYLVASPTAKDASIQAKKIADANNVKTAITLSDVNMVKFFGDGLKEMIGDGVDLLLCNESELLAYTNTTDLKEATTAIKKVAKTYAITLGSKGALVYDGKEEVTVPTSEVKPIDTTGAGDLFAGAMLHGINHGMTYEQSAKLGNLACAKVITQFGARLQREQTLEIKNSLQ